jgi:hypothetical protein
MATKEEVEKLLAGRSLIDNYRSQKVDRGEEGWTPPSIELLAEHLLALGYASIDDFFAYDRRLSMLEISRCYKGVNRFTGEEPPICDGCLNRDDPVQFPDCQRDSRTGDPLQSKVTCVDNRYVTGVTWTPDAISLEEDSIYQAQDAKYKELGLAFGVKFSIMDAIDCWDLPDHTPASCVAKIVEIVAPDFDPMWGLRK